MFVAFSGDRVPFLYKFQTLQHSFQKSVSLTNSTYAKYMCDVPMFVATVAAGDVEIDLSWVGSGGYQLGLFDYRLIGSRSNSVEY